LRRSRGAARVAPLVTQHAQSYSNHSATQGYPLPGPPCGLKTVCTARQRAQFSHWWANTGAGEADGTDVSLIRSYVWARLTGAEERDSR